MVQTVLKNLMNMPRRRSAAANKRRTLLLVLIHGLLFASVYSLAYYLRLDFDVPEKYTTIMRATLAWVVAIKLVVFYLTGNFFGQWKYVTFSDLVAILRATTISAILIVTFDRFMFPDHNIPRSVMLIDLGLTILCLGGVRSLNRISKEHFWPNFQSADEKPALLVGTDTFCVTLVRHLKQDLRLGYRVVGFVDPDRSKWGTNLGGIEVVGGLDNVVEIASDMKVSHVLVASGSFSGGTMRDLLKRCSDGGLSVRIIPELSDVIHSNHRINVRDVDINDLLRRDPVHLDMQAIEAQLRGKTVLVTGAGGSIGSEICRQVLRFAPRKLVLVEQAENSLFHIERELRAMQLDVLLPPCIADVLDRDRMEQIFRDHHPQVIFHAAAHKHVPMMEANVAEAVKNNVQGTKTVADLADLYQAERFVMISTDKAVNPTSIMGVTKQLAERYVHAMSQESGTRFVAVRFGNVLGSAGSVVPIFQEQIRGGGPITITDERMTRFFMSIPEASQLVLQAAAMGKGGEIFVLDMGEPVRIVDLASDLIRLSGVPADRVQIEFTGMRPGEKLYEELYFADEQTLETMHPKVRAAYHRPISYAEVSEELRQLFTLVNRPGEVIRHKLRELVPDYAPMKSASTIVATVDSDVAATMDLKEPIAEVPHSPPDLVA